MVLAGPGLLVSVPAREIGGFFPSGSLIAREELRDLALTPALSTALDLAEQLCRRRRARLLIATRPEMFTHGASLEWLRARLRGIGDHLCLSDGSALRPMPGLRNHLFLYGQEIASHAEAFLSLSRRVPRLFACLDSQVNSCVSLRVGRELIRPKPLLLQAAAARRPRTHALAYVYTPGADLASSVLQTLAAPLPLAAGAARWHELAYLLATEAGCRDKTAAKVMFDVLRHARDKPARGVVVQLPELGSAAAGAEQRLAVVLEGLRAVGLSQAAVRAESLLFTLDEPAPAALLRRAARVDLLMHSAFPFWRHPPAHYRTFRSVQVFGAGAAPVERTAWRRLLTPALGRCPEFRRPSATRATRWPANRAH